mmetsp:Transcript_7296/g.15814  ORF Transcript_7296/g.15814 Transcript_7296/m.15814 type:complete len:230 (-) Transcript_7296:58-747(-)
MCSDRPSCDGANLRSSEEWIRVFDADTLAKFHAGNAQSRLHAVEVGSPARRVLLAFVRGEVLAVDARCGHRGGPLELGDLEDAADALGGGPVVRCPWHGRMYCLRTGRELWQGWRASASPVQRPHAVQEREDGVYLRMKSGKQTLGSCPSDDFACPEPDRADFACADPDRAPASLGVAGTRRLPRSTMELFLATEDPADKCAGVSEASGQAAPQREAAADDFIPDEFLF